MAHNWHREVLNNLVFFSCPLKPRPGGQAVPHLAALQRYRQQRPLKAERDFEGMRVEWFDVTELPRIPDQQQGSNDHPASDLLTADCVADFIDCRDGETAAGVI